MVRWLAVSDTRQRTQRLALAARAHDDDLLRGRAFQIVRIDQVYVLNLEIAQLAGDIGVLNHGTPRDNNLAAVGHRGIGNLLQAVDMGSQSSR